MVAIYRHTFYLPPTNDQQLSNVGEQRLSLQSMLQYIDANICILNVRIIFSLHVVCLVSAQISLRLEIKHENTISNLPIQ